jgi:PTS system mannose-specific IIA component
MSVSILIISHNEIGTALVNTVKITLGNQLPLPVATVELTDDADPDVLIPRLKNVVKALDQGDGVLILTDLYGSTPSNIAQHLQSNNKVLIVTGLNLPMLIRIMNYPQLPLDQLSEKALTGGQSGIIECEHKPQED